MNERRKKILTKLNLDETAFAPNKETQTEALLTRIADMEDALIELAEILTEG